MNVDVSVIIVSFNTAGLLRNCLNALRIHSSNLAIQTIVVDNNSRDGTPDMVRREFPSAVLIPNPENRGFARANNQGLEKASGEFVFLLNPDTEICPGTIQRLRKTLAGDSGIGAVGPRTYLDQTFTFEVCSLKLLTPGRSLLLFSRLPFPGRNRILQSVWQIDGRHWEARNPTPVEGIGGAAIMMSRDLLRSMGGLDERFFMGYEDTDLAARLKSLGYSVYLDPGCKIIHLFGQSKQLPGSPRKATYSWHQAPSRYLKKHHGYLSCVTLACAKCLESPFRSPGSEFSSVSYHPGNPPSDITMTWPAAGEEDYLFEWSNQPVFYDKFAARVHRNSIIIPGSLMARLDGDRWFWRVFRWPMTRHPEPLTQGIIVVK
ncbi:glycosyltransferase [bacterium]|nr:glycosyltransferase [candidate division CSSED10-310 bacterium]